MVITSTQSPSAYKQETYIRAVTILNNKKPNGKFIQAIIGVYVHGYDVNHNIWGHYGDPFVAIDSSEAK